MYIMNFECNYNRGFSRCVRSNSLITCETSQASWRTSRPPQSWEPIQISEERSRPTKLKLKHWLTWFVCVCRKIFQLTLCNVRKYFFWRKVVFLWTSSVIKSIHIYITSSTALLVLQKHLTEHQGRINIHDLSGSETTPLNQGLN